MKSNGNAETRWELQKLRLDENGDAEARRRNGEIRCAEAKHRNGQMGKAAEKRISARQAARGTDAGSCRNEKKCDSVDWIRDEKRKLVRENNEGGSIMIELEKRTYTLTGFTPMLGSSPANPDVRSAYLCSKAKDPNASAQEEAEYLRRSEEDKMTVFLRDPGSGALMLLDYQVKGYFKGSLEALVAQTGVKAPRGKADRYVFVSPRQILIRRTNGDLIIDDDGDYERPLRANTMQGERIALASSEQVDDPWMITFTVSLLPNTGSKVSKGITWEDIERALDYGELRGLGQFRNGGFGRFTWRREPDGLEA